jgi:hypothetical protein
VIVRRAPFALAALAVLVLLAGCGGHSGAKDAPRPALYVSADHGRCDDGRSRTQAGSPATPLCTIARALKLAPPDSEVRVAPGRYPALTVSDKREQGWVTVMPSGRGAVTLPRIEIDSGASWLAFRGLNLTGSAAGPTFQVAEGGSRHISLSGSHVQAQRQDAIVLRSGTGDVTIAGNLIHTAPIGSGVLFLSSSTLPGSPPGSEDLPPITNVTIRDNHFDGIGVDAIRPTNFDRLLIEGNEINGVVDNGEHADVLQTVFGGRHLIFRNNYVHDNRAQGLFIKDGQVTDAVIENNVFVHNSHEITVQVLDTVGLRLINNTVWNNQYNVMLRDGVRDALVVNNIFQDMVVEDPADAASQIHQDHNLIAGGWNWGARGPHDIKTAPTFVDPARGDYRLAQGSAGIDAGLASSAPRLDKACRARFNEQSVRDTGVGDPRYVDLGALEASPKSAAGDTAAPGAACTASSR